MVKICQTGLLKLNFETRPKKRIFRFLPKISAGHGWSWKIFFANFQILGPLGCQGWVVIPQNVKKSQNHCTLICNTTYQGTGQVIIWGRYDRCQDWPNWDTCHTHPTPPSNIGSNVFLSYSNLDIERNAIISLLILFKEGFLGNFRYLAQHCFMWCHTDSNVSEDAGIEPGTVGTSALAGKMLWPLGYFRSHPFSYSALFSKLFIFIVQ